MLVTTKHDTNNGTSGPTAAVEGACRRHGVVAKGAMTPPELTTRNFYSLKPHVELGGSAGQSLSDVLMFWCFFYSQHQQRCEMWWEAVRAAIGGSERERASLVNDR